MKSAQRSAPKTRRIAQWERFVDHESAAHVGQANRPFRSVRIGSKGGSRSVLRKRHRDLRRETRRHIRPAAARAVGRRFRPRPSDRRDLPAKSFSRPTCQAAAAAADRSHCAAIARRSRRARRRRGWAQKPSVHRAAAPSHARRRPPSARPAAALAHCRPGTRDGWLDCSRPASIGCPPSRLTFARPVAPSAAGPPVRQRGERGPAPLSARPIRRSARWRA